MTQDKLPKPAAQELVSRERPPLLIHPGSAPLDAACEYAWKLGLRDSKGPVSDTQIRWVIETFLESERSHATRQAT